MISMKKKIAHTSKDIVIVPSSEVNKCGRLDAKHYTSKEHERLCKSNKN